MPGHDIIKVASALGEDKQQRAHVLAMPAARPNLSASSLIWTASSRVGAITSMVGPTRGSLRVWLQ